MGNHQISEKNIIKIMRDEYHQRLTEAIAEADVFDSRDNMVIGQDLKVRHKKSQYEYTVDDVIEDDESGDVQVILRLPDEPRFEPPPDESDVVITDTTGAMMIGEEDAISLEPPLDATTEEEFHDAPDEEVFVVSKEEFEKEYEVK
tara:strand:- start:5022 stop:5459 length:438 start_codon:yes stop_codon:yes gene_type:complete